MNIITNIRLLFVLAAAIVLVGACKKRDDNPSYDNKSCKLIKITQQGKSENTDHVYYTYAGDRLTGSVTVQSGKTTQTNDYTYDAQGRVIAWKYVEFDTATTEKIFSFTYFDKYIQAVRTTDGNTAGAYKYKMGGVPECML